MYKQGRLFGFGRPIEATLAVVWYAIVIWPGSGEKERYMGRPLDEEEIDPTDGQRSESDMERTTAPPPRCTVDDNDDVTDGGPYQLELNVHVRKMDIYADDASVDLRKCIHYLYVLPSIGS
ncbi:uncharacterized protein LOC750617 [Anopheles sinensis]|uniref:Uncharacterized protein LOC750617 n=1 Tax=Anopheles sinensis TaxID=74873 RepID=A0A084W828_ANOSI|nr:uncharacterized protein LOC750617 [Anopheles sinensis]